MQKEHVKSDAAKKTQEIIKKTSDIKTANRTEVDKSKGKGDQASKWKNGELKQRHRKKILKARAIREEIKVMTADGLKEHQKFQKPQGLTKQGTNFKRE